MEWESPVWKLYAQLSTQWRVGFSGRTGLDYGPVAAAAARRGWNVDLALELIGAIERAVLDWDNRERSSPQG